MIRKLFELSPGTEVFTLDCQGEKINYSDFQIISKESFKVNDEQIYTEIAHKDNFKSRLVLIEKEKKFKLYMQLSADWPMGIQQELKINVGFLSDIFSAREGERTFYFTSGSKIIQPHRYFLMPYCIVDEKTQDAFSIRFENMFNENWIAWDQNRGTDFIFNIKNESELKNHNLVIRPSNEFSDIFIFDIVKVKDGFNGFFLNYKEEERGKLNLSLYDREELMWYRQTVLQHFTFLFGKEAYDYKNDKFDLERLLQDGESFGGYDSLILWHQYPRLGIDERSQWEFFDDFPQGGRCGIKKIVEEANRRGVKVFLPFKPWDIDPSIDENQVTSDFVNLLRDTGVNGMFFDTMTAVPESFREAADEIDRGFAFCTEGKPRTVENLQLVTGSWDQFWNRDCVLEINIARYIIPENAAPMISRWHVGESRLNFIKRAIWNGTGLVIWQDVFGAWCPYDPEHKKIIKKWKKILKDNIDIYFGEHAMPLLKTLNSEIYCNYFRSGTEEIYSVYNNSNETISGNLLKLKSQHIKTVKELWYGRKIEVVKDKNELFCSGEIHPKEILIIKGVNYEKN